MKNYLKLIEEASENIKDVALVSPLEYSVSLSEKYNSKIYLKREDKQIVRSFKIRGAYNKMRSLTNEEKSRGVVCASAGNHAQGVAFSCFKLKIKGTIYMPAITPNQKIGMVKKFGGKYVTIELKGTTFDEAYHEAIDFCKKKKMIFVHPFNDPLVIAGQGTIGKEITEQLDEKVDYILAGIGGGGLISGISSYFKEKKLLTKFYGVEPAGAASMAAAIKNDGVIVLDKIDSFVDGAATRSVGDETFRICKENLEKVLIVPEGKVCTTMVQLYQNDGIITEPAGALGISALDLIKDKIAGKTVVCIVSGGNNDILRYPEILERSMLYEGIRHYFIIKFAQKPGQLKTFLLNVLGPEDDIIRFEYVKKTNAEKGPALVGVEVSKKENFAQLEKRMVKAGFAYTLVNDNDFLFKYIV